MSETAGARRTIFLTGGTGFIGSRLATALLSDQRYRLRCLTRSLERVTSTPRCAWVVGDLGRPASYQDALDGADCVVHLAARVGGGSRSEHERTNLVGTRDLLSSCRAAGVHRFLYVSSIAVTYGDRRGYPYAESKRLAEEAVRVSGLDVLTVRPTMVLGPGSAIQEKLRRMVALPWVPLVGDGRVRVQPIHVSDVAAYLARRVADAAPWGGATVELGGPEVVTMEEMLRRIHRARSPRPLRLVRLPARPVIALLRGLEGVLGPALPVSAGQFAAFVHDSTAALDPSAPSGLPTLHDLDAMLEPANARE